MRIVKPRGIISGFHAVAPDAAVPELLHLGEQWAPQGYEIPRHAHPVWEFYLQLHGESVWRDALGNEYRCPAGTFFAPRPKLEHWLHQASEGKHHFLFAAIDVEALVAGRASSLKPAWEPRHAIHILEGRNCELSFLELVRETAADRPFRTVGLRSALDALVVAVSRMLLGSSKVQERQWLNGHPAVEVARHAIETHPSEPWTLSDLGRLAGVSPNHLVNLFSAEVGESPHRYLLKVRIDRAREMLRSTDASVTDIAHELGFHSSQHFARTFRQVCACSASEFRRRVAG